MNDFPAISFMTLLPFVGAVLLLGVEKEQRRFARGMALGFSFAALVMTVLIWLNFDPEQSELQFVERLKWIPSLGVEYFVGLDGLGLIMIVLTAMVAPMSILASWHIEDRVPLKMSLILFLQAGLFGTFTALNFFHWFLFWELSLIPAFFLIKLWGGRERSPAATQFFVYTMVGSIAMLLAFLALFVATKSFDFIELAEKARAGEIKEALSINLGWYTLDKEPLALIIFLGVLLGFAVKVPLMPFHTWLPATYAEAPSGTTMLLTGVMSKMGVYGFLRILLPIFPEQVRMILTPLLFLAVITIVFSACAAFVQRDLKRMLAYSSINHLGYCLLGVFAVAQDSTSGSQSDVERSAALTGVLLQMFNHGITAATLFCFIGFLEQRSGGLRQLDDFGGLRTKAPVFCGLMGISLFASLGLPGLNGFVGEFLIFKGVFPLATWAAVLSCIALLVTAVFLLTLLQRVFNGPLNPKWSGFSDLTQFERMTVIPATALMFALGLFPQLAVEKLNATVVLLVENLRL